MSPFAILSLIVVYFGLLFIISYFHHPCFNCLYCSIYSFIHQVLFMLLLFLLIIIFHDFLLLFSFLVLLFNLLSLSLLKFYVSPSLSNIPSLYLTCQMVSLLIFLLFQEARLFLLIKVRFQD